MKSSLSFNQFAYNKARTCCLNSLFGGILQCNVVNYDRQHRVIIELGAY